MFLNIYPKQNNTTQPTFGYGIPKKSFSDIRDIPGLTCAKCGHKMISLPERDKFIDSLLDGAKDCLQRPEFNEYRKSNPFRFLFNLAKKHPRTSLAKIVEDKKVQYKISRFGKFDQTEIREIVDVSKDFLKNAPQVMKKIYPLREKMPEDYKELLDYMELYSLKYPKSKFSEIFNKPEVIEYHNKLRLYRAEQFKIMKDFELGKLEKLGAKLTPEEKAVFQKLNNQANKIISQPFYPQKTKQIMLDILYKDFLNGLQNKKLAAKIKSQVGSLPFNENRGDNLIINMGKMSDREILTSIVNNLASTFEHIVPASQNGGRAKANGICLCKKCNQERATIAYSALMEYFPNFAENLQKQLNKIVVFIKNGKLNNYDHYPVKVKKTLLDVTNQKLRINIKKYLKYKDKAAAVELENAKAVLTNNKNLLKETKSELSSHNAKINKLVKELKQLVKEKKALKNKQINQAKQVDTAEKELKLAEENHQYIHEKLLEDK